MKKFWGDVRISIDDCGTGYSSLSQLKRLPVDTLKFDQSFVADVTEDADDQAIVSSIVAMAKHMNLRVIAEGVETAGQLDALRARGCDEVQGFLLSEPVAGEALYEMMHKGPAIWRTRTT